MIAPNVGGIEKKPPKISHLYLLRNVVCCEFQYYYYY